MLQIESNIDNVTKLPKNLNLNNINDLINILSDDNKKKLILSLLNNEIKCITNIDGIKKINIECNTANNNKIKLNIIIHLFLREYNHSFIIYPINLNIIHFILFNNLNINKLLIVLLLLYYIKYIAICGYREINHNYSYKNGYCINYDAYMIDQGEYKIIKKYVDDLCSTINLNIINLNFNHDYNELLYDNNNNNYNYSSIYEEVYSLRDNDIHEIKTMIGNINYNIVTLESQIEDNNKKLLINKITKLENNNKLLGKLLEDNNKLLNDKINILERKITYLEKNNKNISANTNKLLEDKITYLEKNNINILLDDNNKLLEDKITNLEDNVSYLENNNNKILLFILIFILSILIHNLIIGTLIQK
jgi:hypothetical protein